MKWIHIDELLPEKGQDVFYYFGFFNKVYKGKFCISDGYNCFFDEGGFLCGDVTYWMPYNEGDDLPEIPSLEERMKDKYHPYNEVGQLKQDERIFIDDKPIERGKWQ